jgi:uncharacterized membrane protein YfhO
MPTDNPAAWVTSAMIKAPQNQALSAILDPGFDQRTVAIFDTTAKDIQAAQIQALPAAATINARVTKYEPGVIDMTLDAPSTAGQALVVSENYFPGWHAIVDGKPSAVGQANYNLIGIALPAGSKNVQLRFTDSSYEKGKAITLVMLLISFAMWIGGAIAERRRRQPVAAVA